MKNTQLHKKSPNNFLCFIFNILASISFPRCLRFSILTSPWIASISWMNLLQGQRGLAHGVGRKGGRRARGCLADWAPRPRRVSATKSASAPGTSSNVQRLAVIDASSGRLAATLLVLHVLTNLREWGLCADADQTFCGIPEWAQKNIRVVLWYCTIWFYS